MRKKSQLVVGLDPRLDLLPMELRGEAVLGRRRGRVVRRALLQGDRGRGRPVRRRGEAAVRLLRGARLGRLPRARGGLRLRARRGTSRPLDAKRGDIGSTVAGVRGGVSRAAGRRVAARGRDDGEPVPRPGLGRALPRRLPSPRRRRLLPRPDVERRCRRRPGPRDVGRPPALAPRRASSSTSGASRSSARPGCRASAPSSVRRSRGPSPRRAGCSRIRRCCSPESAHRARRRPTSPGLSPPGLRAPR